MRVWIGIDNGVTGSIGIICENGAVSHVMTPTVRELSYTSKRQYITRIDHMGLRSLLEGIIPEGYVKCLLERPMVNFTRFKQSMSAIRALEATLIVLEGLEISYQYVDSKKWQRELLPCGVRGSVELKKAAVDVARRLFPNIKTKDADSLLIAEYARRHFL